MWILVIRRMEGIGPMALEVSMTLHERVSRLDDYAGELTLALKKLEIEQSRGGVDRDQQADFLQDLRKAMELRDLKPMRDRTLLDLALAALTFLAALLLPKGMEFRNPTLMVLLALCLLGLVMAGWRFSLYVRRRHHDLRWLRRLETTVASGGTIFDAH